LDSIGFGTPDLTWKQYGLTENPILINGRETGYKAVLRDGQLVTIVSNAYQLFPNEEALKIADEAAKRAGLEPFNVSSGAGIRREGHAIYNLGRTRMHAIYTPRGAAHRIDGEEVKVGVDVQNSIDGSTSFGCGVFTYRFICGNGVILGYQKLFGIRRIHTKGLTAAINDLKNRMILVMEQAQDIVGAYQRMAQRRVTEELIERIKKSRLSKKVLPDYLTAEEPTIQVDHLTEWQLYNDITEAIWHNAKAGLRTKTFQFQVLHQVMPLEARTA